MDMLAGQANNAGNSTYDGSYGASPCFAQVIAEKVCVAVYGAQAHGSVT